MEMKKERKRVKQPVYLGFSVPDLSKILVSEFWYDYVKQKYGEKEKLSYMDKDSILYIKADDNYKDIAEYFEIRFNTSNYELESPLPKRKYKTVIGLLRDELGVKIMTKFIGLRAKTYVYLKDDGSEDKKAKDTTKCVSKKNLKLENCKDCLEATQLDNETKYLQKNKIIINSFKRDPEEFIRNN